MPSRKNVFALGQKGKAMKVKKVLLRGYYNLDGEYLPFADNPLHGKTFSNVDVSFSEHTRNIGGVAYVSDIVNIEGCEPIECELVGHHKTADGTLVISICQDWG